LAGLPPGRVRTIEPDRIQALDLDAAEASIALDPEQFAGDLGKPPLLDGQPWLPGGARVPEKGLPVFLR
jgi:hypothetical protein